MRPFSDKTCAQAGVIVVGYASSKISRCEPFSLGAVRKTSRSTSAASGDSAGSSRREKLHANNRISANRCVGRLSYIGLGRAPPTGLFEIAHVVGGHRGKRQLLYPACLVCSPIWSSNHCNAHIRRLPGSHGMSIAAVFRNGHSISATS
jgi:hypothetical protein